MYYKRTLILNDINNKNSNKKGVITLENDNNIIKGQLKLYNFVNYPQEVSLGVASAENIVKVPIKINDNVINFEIKENINLQEKISCAMVDISRITNPQIIVGGTSNYLNDWADRVEQAFVQDAKVLEKDEIYENNIQEIEKEISTVLREDKEYKDCSMCVGCKYKEAFYNAQDVQTPGSLTIEDCHNGNVAKINQILATATLGGEEEKNQKVKEDQKEQEENIPPQKEEQLEFYEQIKDQIDDLFKNHSREESLELIIPNSKWVRVEYQDVEGHYVMGLIYDQDTLRFISYGLPSKDNKTPPQDLEEYAQWIPMQNESMGYWVVYQNAKDGQSIKIE